MLFLITGWATDQTIWPKWLKQLAVEPDETDFSEYSSLEKAFLACWQEKQEQINVLGWSLGGMLALELALKHSDKIKQIILVSTTAKFTKVDDYQAGLDATVVKNLQRKLNRNQQQTQAGFYQLMFCETEEPYKQVYLQEYATNFYQLNLNSLHKGLTYLLEQDLRSKLGQIKVPCKIIHGLSDQICLPSAARYLQKNISGSKSYFLEKTGHIPFFTQELKFREIIEGCLGGLENVR